MWKSGNVNEETQSPFAYDKCNIVKQAGAAQHFVVGHIKDVRCEANIQQLCSRCFEAAGPKLWNSLPAEPRQADISFQRFKWLLKTFLFGC